MPLRGSVRLLLPTLRSRLARRAGLGVFALVLAALGATIFRDAFPTIEKDGLAQTLRQSVWAQALSGQSTPTHWPWEDLTANLSLTPSSKVPRLGLSASVQLEPIKPPRSWTAVPRSAAPKKTRATSVAGDLALRDVTIGDSITFTAADGAICIYRVTGQPVVDPHLAGDAGRAVGGSSLFECDPLESLILNATQAATQAAPKSSPAGDQHKL